MLSLTSRRVLVLVPDLTQTSKSWDENMVFGCVCDSEWAVGVGSGQRQVAEWFGADCSLRTLAHCCSHCAREISPNSVASCLQGTAPAATTP